MSLISGMITNTISDKRPKAKRYVKTRQSGRQSFLKNLRLEFFKNLKTLVSNPVKKTLSTKAMQSAIIIGVIKPIRVEAKPKTPIKLKTSAKIIAERKTISKILRVAFASSFI